LRRSASRSSAAVPAHQALMQLLIKYARSEGLKSLFGDVLNENSAMLAMCRPQAETSVSLSQPTRKSLEFPSCRLI
jgi:hypothetical protein